MYYANGYHGYQWLHKQTKNEVVKTYPNYELTLLLISFFVIIIWDSKIKYFGKVKFQCLCLETSLVEYSTEVQGCRQFPKSYSASLRNQIFSANSISSAFAFFI